MSPIYLDKSHLSRIIEIINFDRTKVVFMPANLFVIIVVVLLGLVLIIESQFTVGLAKVRPEE